jgi:hypothetical protein
VLCTLAGTVLMAVFLRGLTGWVDLGQGWSGFGWLCLAGLGGLALYAICAIPVIHDLRPKPASQS